LAIGSIPVRSNSVPSSATGALASHLIGRAVLREGVQLMAAAGIPVMPLKGIWLQQFVYPELSTRRITDVDVLVPDARYESALRLLEHAGWRRCAANISEAAYIAPAWPLPLDVHRRLFTRGAYRMPSTELFARGVPDSDAFGVRVILPDPLDVLAHLIGHFVKSRGAGGELDDVRRLVERYRLDPLECARRLESCGLARASRFALPLMAAGDARGFASEVVSALSADPVGNVIAEALIALRTHTQKRSFWAGFPGFALERSLARSALVFALRAWDKRLEETPTLS
jgi:hypothetical protein